MNLKILLVMLGLVVALGGTATAQDEPPDPARKDRVEPKEPADRGPPAAGGQRPHGPREGRPGDDGQGPRRPDAFNDGQGRPNPHPNPNPSSNPDNRRFPGPPREGFQPSPGGPGMRGPGMPGHGMGGHNMPDMERLKDSDPEMYKVVQAEMDLDRSSHELGEQFRRAAGDARAEIKEKLTETVEKHFQVRSERRELEVKRLEEQVARLRESMNKRTEQKKDIVERRLSELMGKEYEISF